MSREESIAKIAEVTEKLIPKEEAKEAPISAESAPIPELSEIEREAMSYGWRPKSEFEGVESDFVSAQEFMDRAPLYKQIHKFKKQNEKLEAQVNELVKNYTLAEKRGREQALAELKAQKKQAYIDGDNYKAERLEAEHEKLLREAKMPEEPVSEVTPDQIMERQEWKDFNARNPWFANQASDPKSIALRAKAIKLANEFAEAAGNVYNLDSHLQAHIDYIEEGLGLKKDIKVAESPAPHRPAPVSRVTPKKSGTHKSGPHPKYNLLSPIQKMIVDQHCGEGKAMSVDSYIKSLEDNGSLPKE